MRRRSRTCAVWSGACSHGRLRAGRVHRHASGHRRRHRHALWRGVWPVRFTAIYPHMVEEGVLTLRGGRLAALAHDAAYLQDRYWPSASRHARAAWHTRCAGGQSLARCRRWVLCCRWGGAHGSGLASPRPAGGRVLHGNRHHPMPAAQRVAGRALMAAMTVAYGVGLLLAKGLYSRNHRCTSAFAAVAGGW